jgi:hypothetical protein
VKLWISFIRLGAGSSGEHGHELNETRAYDVAF